ncbi:MAG: MraY family glycosyltransferase, partial [Flavobacteriales bacterium]|nr:MraY family glycosyltransferase [Flavobacteriales bacterium]
NTILLKFSTTLGIRENEKPLIRWSSVSRPALGGISFYISFLIGTTSFGIFFNNDALFNDGQVIGLLFASSLAFLMGLADDAYNTKPFLKFFVQITCAGILIFSGNYSVQETSFTIQLFDNETLNIVLTLLWVVGIMNSINMLDNMDGITAITSLFILLTAILFLAINNDFKNYDFIVLLAVFASLIGFLFHNWNPSKMFMGDSGSQFLGLLIAAVGIKYFWNSTDFITNELITTKQIVMILIVFILPICDTTSVVINRLARKQSPFIGGKDHTTHHLSYLGFTDSQIAFIYLGVSFLSVIISISLYRFINDWSYLIALGFFIYFLGIFSVLYITTQQNKDKRS